VFFKTCLICLLEYTSLYLSNRIAKTTSQLACTGTAQVNTWLQGHHQSLPFNADYIPPLFRFISKSDGQHQIRKSESESSSWRTSVLTAHPPVDPAVVAIASGVVHRAAIVEPAVVSKLTLRCRTGNPGDILTKLTLNPWATRSRDTLSKLILTPWATTTRDPLSELILNSGAANSRDVLPKLTLTTWTCNSWDTLTEGIILVSATSVDG
jgi:hypothetical protein